MSCLQGVRGMPSPSLKRSTSCNQFLLEHGDRTSEFEHLRSPSDILFVGVTYFINLYHVYHYVLKNTDGLTKACPVLSLLQYMYQIHQSQISLQLHPKLPKLSAASPQVKSIFVNIFGGIARCDHIATAVVAGVQAVGGNAAIKPLVIRLEGRKMLGR